MTDFAHCAVTVVRCSLHNNSNATGTISFKSDLFIGCPRKLTRSALDGALDIVRGHVFCFCSSNGGAQTRIAVRVSTGPCSDGDFLYQASKNLAALCVESTFFVLDTVPF